MSFHEELNQKLNVFFNRDWFVELSEQEEEKMEELAAGLVKDFGWDTVFHAAFKYLKGNCRTPRVCNVISHICIGNPGGGITRLKSHTGL